MDASGVEDDLPVEDLVTDYGLAVAAFAGPDHPVAIWATPDHPPHLEVGEV